MNKFMNVMIAILWGVIAAFAGFSFGAGGAVGVIGAVIIYLLLEKKLGS